MSELIQILGPTGVGKSSAAVELARRIGGEIISADSMQVYKGFNIGAAKITDAEKQGIPHHLIDTCDACAQFNASMFLRECFDISEAIRRRGHIPIVCGGTALYLRSIIQGIFPENKDKRVSREFLNRVVDKRGIPYLWERLNKVDPQYAEKIGPNDRVRVVRGMEIYYNNGIPPSEIFKRTRTPFESYTILRIGLNMERPKLYRRIEQRVDQMIRDGLEAEIMRLLEIHPSDCAPFKSVGYKEMLQYLSGELSLDEAVALIKQHSRNFAKRQMSWFRQESDIHWFNPAQIDAVENLVRKRLHLPTRRVDLL